VLSIQTIMLVALGFLAATLFALLVAPMFWSRAVRLTTQRLKSRLPLTEAEIKADKDRLRAEYAIRVHKLETKVEQAELVKARHLIDLNRRDAHISILEREVVSLRANLEENQNARRVLEQTVADRLPKVEQRLGEAKTLLFNRDREIAELTQSMRRQQMALEEATAINSQQTSEIDRLNTALTTRGARNRQQFADPRFEGELALRAEIEALRAKTREQAALVARMQSQLLRNPGSAAAATGEALVGPPPGLTPAVAAGSADGDGRLHQQMRELEASNRDQAAELSKLRAELDTLKGGGGEVTGLRDTKLALKARVKSAEAVAAQQAETIRRLRAEVAAANERLALQGVQYVEQMRRLGAGTAQASGPASGPQRRERGNGRTPLAERVAMARVPRTMTAVPPRPSEVPAAAKADAGKSGSHATAAQADAAFPAAATVDDEARQVRAGAQDRPAPALSAPAESGHEVSAAIVPLPADRDRPAAAEPAAPARPRLAERIAGLAKG
jgi:hypothetical protein